MQPCFCPQRPLQTLTAKNQTLISQMYLRWTQKLSRRRSSRIDDRFVIILRCSPCSLIIITTEKVNTFLCVSRCIKKIYLSSKSSAKRSIEQRPWRKESEHRGAGWSCTSFMGRLTLLHHERESLENLILFNGFQVDNLLEIGDISLCN